MIVLQTNLGDIEIKLNHEMAPKTAANFEQYVKDGHYDGTIFHRVIKGFMIQGGGYSPDMEQKDTREPIENEANNGLANQRGTIAMARTNDPHSATAQFFINTVNNDFLNFRSKDVMGWGYCVFGEVVKGMDVVDKIEGVKTHTVGYFSDVPVETCVITRAIIKDDDEQ